MALITLEELKTHLGITGDTDNSILETTVNTVNSFVPMYCNRTFEEATYTKELYDGTGTVSLILKHTPVTSIMEVLVNTEEVTERTDVGEEGYYCKDPLYGIIFYDNAWDRGRGIIEVTYKAGYTDETIPSDLKYACLRLGEYIWNIRNKAGILAENLGSYSYRIATGLESMNGVLTIPDVLVANILDRYRQKTFPWLVY